MTFDVSALLPRTLIFCHSLNFVVNDTERLSHQLRQSGARRAIVVSNEKIGSLGEIADRLDAEGITCHPTFHVPVPDAELEMRIPFSVQVTGGDFRMLSQHFVRILLDCELTEALLTSVERELRRLTGSPQVQLVEAAYCYRLRD